jgi:PKD repeat protein
MFAILFTPAAFAQTAPEIVYFDMPDGKVGKWYSGYVVAKNCDGLSIASGSLPPGLEPEEEVDGNYCELYVWGEPTTVGTYPFTVKAQNASGGSATRAFTINITIPDKPTITTTSLPNGKVGKYYDQRLQATDDVDEWEIASGDLPPGLWLDNSGRIYGAPTASGAYTFTVMAENELGIGTKEFTINIPAPPPPKITTTSLPDGLVGVPYEQDLYGTEYVDEWRIVNGELPPGFELISSWDGYIYGTPTEEMVGKTYTFTVKAENESGFDEKTFIIKIAMPQKPKITTASLPSAGIGYFSEFPFYYKQELKATEYAEWSIVSGELPTDFELSSEGFILCFYYYCSITPDMVGKTYTFTVKAENASGSDTKEFTIKIVSLEIATNSLPNGVVGGGYYSELKAIGEAEWSIANGSLPPGLWLNGMSIRGEPTKAGEYTFTVKAENDYGDDTKEFTIKITMPKPPVITNSVLPNGIVDKPYAALLSTSAEYAEWSIANGSLPPGLVLFYGIYDTYINGEPTKAGTYTFTLKAENASSSDTKQFTIIIADVPQKPVIITDLPDGIVGERYELMLEATWPSTWSIVDDELPPGFYLYVTSYTYISGIPTTAGTYTFTLKAENDAGSGIKEFTITIRDESTPILPPQIATSNASNIVAHAMGNSIVLQNLPAGAKVEVFDLRGRGVAGNALTTGNTITIPVHAKGMYVVKVSRGVSHTPNTKDTPTVLRVAVK